MGLFFNKKTKNIERILPTHVGIIMDGNGRWAKKRGLPRFAGHSAGAKTFKDIARYCIDIGIKYVTFFAFSTENWKRPKDEVNAIMKLFNQYLKEALNDFKDEDVRIIFLGDKSAFSDELRNLMFEVEESSKNRTGMVLNIAINYGGRAEIIMASKKIAKEVADGNLLIDNINEEIFSNYLYTKSQPDLDLVIRPSGEYRISNFLLWQSAYAEYVILNDVLWPDFKTEDFEKAILEYSKRNRRFGGV